MGIFAAVGFGVTGLLGLGVLGLGLTLILGGGGTSPTGEDESVAQVTHSSTDAAPSENVSSQAATTRPTQQAPRHPASASTASDSQNSNTSTPNTASWSAEPNGETRDSSSAQSNDEDTPSSPQASSAEMAEQSTPQQASPSMNRSGGPLDPVRTKQNILELPKPGSSRAPVLLTEINLQENELEQFELSFVGANDNQSRFTTTKIPNSSPPTWEVNVPGAGNLGQERHDATFQLTPEGLMFHWEVRTPVADMIFYPLVLAATRTGENRDEERCQLFKPTTLPPIPIKFDRPVQTFQLHSEKFPFPDSDILKLRVEHEGLGENIKVSPSGEVTAGSDLSILIPDPDFPEDPLISFDISFESKDGDIELKVANNLMLEWVHEETREPELVKKPLSLTGFDDLEKEGKRLARTLAQRVDELNGQINRLKGRSRGRTSSERAALEEQLEMLENQRSDCEAAMISLNDVEIIKDIATKECERLQQNGRIQVLFEIVPDSTKPDERVVVVRANND